MPFLAKLSFKVTEKNDKTWRRNDKSKTLDYLNIRRPIFDTILMNVVNVYIYMY